MKDFRYLDGVTTLVLNEEKCIGCGECETVCPHGVFVLEKKKAVIVDKDGCMECGACALNCPVSAVEVTPGVGCAAYIIQKWIKGRNAAECGCGTGCC
ncbi:MAG: 4Fe-4S dicluster domain-containing protein [Desulfobacteraceae bacterium]|nr:MAG: 4Fe-4S dicluster domain-containing protein [Desulfobacteraceae bacterium]